MRILQGRAADHVTDDERTREMTARVADNGEPALRVWTPHPQVTFGRRDTTSDGYEQAMSVARDHGYAVLEREVGGRAVAYTGTTVAFILAEPIDGVRGGIQPRYDRISDAVGRALTHCGIDVCEGEPADAFCPGSHSLQADGKIVGLAQRVRQDVAVVAGIVVVRDHAGIAEVLEPVYDALGVALDRDSVGSISRVGGTDDSEHVVATLQAALAEGQEPRVTHIRET